jgi:simple sugar transport system ATP-binding protein
LKQILKTFEFSLPLDEKISNLSVGEQQRVEIVKALFHRSEVLILDEPTSVLTPIESEELFKTISSFRKLGTAVVFITHKLKEALGISDRISILKSGKKVSELSSEELWRLGEAERYQRIFAPMFGSNVRPNRTPIKKVSEAAPILELDRVVCLGNLGEQRLNGVSFTLRKGEIFGIAGVDGNGQKELVEVIAGQRKIYSGRLILEGKDITHSQGPLARMNLGISYITDDRMQEGCALSMSVAENIILRLFKRAPFSRWKILNMKTIKSYAKELIREFNIKVSGPDVHVSTLSGGNIQKLLLARELSLHPSVLVCNKPTQGLDAKTIRDVQTRLQQESERGAAILFVSPDLDELLNYSDRIGVLYDGELLDILDARNANQENIGKLMLGIPQ